MSDSQIHHFRPLEIIISTNYHYHYKELLGDSDLSKLSPFPTVGEEVTARQQKNTNDRQSLTPPSFLRACTIIDCDETDVFLAGGGLHAFLGFDS